MFGPKECGPEASLAASSELLHVPSATMLFHQRVQCMCPTVLCLLGGALSNGIRRRDVQHVCTVVETGGECGVGVNVGDIFSTVPVFSFF